MVSGAQEPTLTNFLLPVIMLSINSMLQQILTDLYKPYILLLEVLPITVHAAVLETISNFKLPRLTDKLKLLHFPLPIVMISLNGTLMPVSCGQTSRPMQPPQQLTLKQSQLALQLLEQAGGAPTVSTTLLLQLVTKHKTQRKPSQITPTRDTSLL